MKQRGSIGLCWVHGVAIALALGVAHAQEAPASPALPQDAETTVMTTVDAVSTLVVYRINAYPTLRTPKVMVNDRLMFRPKQKTYAEMDLPPGRHRIVVDWSMDTGWPDLGFEVEIRPGEIKYVEISGSFTRNGYEYTAGSVAREVDPAKGAEDIRTCCRRLPLR
ncbi:DUF2846 domain-containing protein [Lysobacter brunescens]|uniref:DUF2846 domain-containing protein n=1 Tax=Lysobacter brunescens TaxID=262323 RepID=A0ABW2Y752_9GAMM